MLQLILGRAGSGKSNYILKLLEELIASGKDDIVMLIPEQFSFHTERAVLERLGEKEAVKVDVLSFTRLAHTVFSLYGGKAGNPLDDAGRTILMSLAVESVTDKLELYKRHAQSPAIISQMLSLAHEFKQNALSLDLIGNALSSMEESIVKYKLREISLILGAYEALVSEGYFDVHDELTDLYKSLLTHPFFEGKTVLLDAFHWFTGQELKVLEAVFSQAQSVYLSLCMDELFPLEKGENGVFAHTKQTAARVLNAAKKAGTSIQEPILLSAASSDLGKKRCSDKALCTLEQAIYNPFAKVYEGQTDAITIVSASDMAEECEYVAASVKKLLREEGYRCREVAIIARDSKKYDLQMTAALKKCGIPVFVDERQSLVTQPPIVLLRAALDIAVNGFSVDSVMRALKTGLAGFDIEETAELENYALLWKINGKKWLNDWINHPEGYGSEMTDRDRDRLIYINELRRRIVGPLEKFSKKLQNTNGEGASRAVYELLISLEVPNNLRDLAFELEEEGEPVFALELQRLWDDLMDILDSFAVSLNQKSVSPRRVADLFDLIIQGRSLGSLPQGIDEVTIGSADRMRTSSPRAVFVIGANEGVFPQNPVSMGILNDEDRNLLLEIGLDVDEPGTHKVKGERFIVYDTLCSAAEKLTVSFARKDMAGASLSPSEIVSGIKQVFPNCLVVDTVDVPDLHFIEGEGPAFESMARLMRQGNKLYMTLRAYFEAKEEYRDRLKSLDRVVKNDNFSMGDKSAAQALFGRNMTVSASRAETYFQCAFKYYCLYGLRAKPRLAAEFDRLQSGTASHFVLEALLTKFPGREISRVDRATIRQEIKLALDAYIEEKMGGLEDKPESFIYRYKRIAKIVESTVDRLIDELENCSFEPVALEFKIGLDGDIKPYEIKMDDGRKLSVIGSIDRVDKMQADGKNYLRVIDYKSSGKRFELSRVFDGINMQMLIYLFALWQNGAQVFEEPIPAGILYVATETPPVNLDRHADKKKLEDAFKKNLKMQGLVLEDELVVKGMENAAGGIFIPAKISKGELSGNLISLEQLKKLNNKTDEILASMVEALHKGEIPAVPAYLSSSIKACQYCDYRDVCGYEDGMPTKPLTQKKHEEALRFLEEGEETSAMDQ